MKFDHIIIAFSTNKRPPSFEDINDKNGILFSVPAGEGRGI